VRIERQAKKADLPERTSTPDQITLYRDSDSLQEPTADTLAVVHRAVLLRRSGEYLLSSSAAPSAN
jgi:hypothetical protein